jgi:hypothetical protein
MERHERSSFSSPVAGKAMHIAFDGGRLTSDAGVLVLTEIERRLGIAERLARCIVDPDPCMGLLKSIADVYACWYFSVLS